jgi:membrane protease YdiL (CAAX protease family)
LRYTARVTSKERLDFVFIGSRGLRAAWRVLLFLFVLIAVQFTISSIWAFLFRPTHEIHVIAALDLVRGVSGGAVGMLLTLLILARIEGVDFGAFGLPLKAAFRGSFWRGAIWGFAALSALLLVLRSLHGFYYGKVVDSVSAALMHGVLYAIGFFFVAFFEETMLRSYPLFALTRGLGFWGAAGMTSLFFAALHIRNPGENPLGIIAVFAVGMLFCLFVRRTGNLWFPIGFHAAWDWAETYFYGVPDSGVVASGNLFHSTLTGPAWLSGGSTGPEGSLLVFVIIGATALAFHLRYPKGHYHPEEVLTRTETRAPGIY